MEGHSSNKRPERRKREGKRRKKGKKGEKEGEAAAEAEEGEEKGKALTAVGMERARADEGDGEVSAATGNRELT